MRMVVVVIVVKEFMSRQLVESHGGGGPVFMGQALCCWERPITYSMLIGYCLLAPTSLLPSLDLAADAQRQRPHSDLR